MTPQQPADGHLLCRVERGIAQCVCVWFFLYIYMFITIIFRIISLNAHYIGILAIYIFLSEV